MSSIEVDPATLRSLETEGLLSRTFRRLDADRQAAVISAIMEEAYQAGPESISIKKVAARAGVSVGSLYQYFGDRDTMLACAVELAARGLAGQFESYMPVLEAMPLREALSSYLSYGIEWSRGEEGFVRFFAAAAYRGARGEEGAAGVNERLVTPIAEALQRVIRGIIQAARGRGELRPDCDDERAARVVNALLIAVGDAALMPGLDRYYRLYDRKHAPTDMIQAVVDLIIHGVGAREGSS